MENNMPVISDSSTHATLDQSAAFQPQPTKLIPQTDGIHARSMPIENSDENKLASSSVAPNSGWHPLHTGTDPTIDAVGHPIEEKKKQDGKGDKLRHHWRKVKQMTHLGALRRHRHHEWQLMDPLSLERQAEINLLPALILALSFQRDEHDKPAVPILLSQIRVAVSKYETVKKHSTRKDRVKHTYRIAVHYGGHDTVHWIVDRRYWDFVKLHYRYRGHDLVRSRLPDIPKLPKRFDHNTKQQQPVDGLHAQNELLQKHGEEIPDGEHKPFVANDSTRLQEYMLSLIQSLSHTPYVNRLCKFLEISSLGLRLAAEEPLGYHGKEGFLSIHRRSDHGPKHAISTLDKLMCGQYRKRREPRWFIVRESYLVCVNQPNETDCYDVFLVDAAFDVQRITFGNDDAQPTRSHRGRTKALGNALKDPASWVGRSTLRVRNTQGVVHLRAKTELVAKQFEESMRKMAQASIWSQTHRFGSFAPIRENCYANWYVDGRDYFWEVSVALDNARESIYIHDWWLSPELFLRRPAAHNSAWRLDKTLQRKADQGVKVYIVMYKEVAVALPLYSHYAKKHLLALSSNICVQRHPSRALDVFKKSSIFFWAHHEKICVVDNAIAFIGGLDLCFGRWDTADHTLVDNLDPSLEASNPNPQIWPGKDYSNPRILDFHTLDRPFDDNMDRTRLPRMPWHDISMRVCGQPARDIARHFVQRWNFLRRRKPSVPKRDTPLLVPKPDFTDFTLPANDPRLGQPLNSKTCRLQILRSVSEWSIGSVDRDEKSIQEAYTRSIEESESFVYIENQFFVTSTSVSNAVIENKIGDALYRRILRAKAENKRWRAFIVIPLVPGFPANVDQVESTTVRLVMHCQYRSIGRGPDSLLARLHAAGIPNTHEYLNFYGLRNWGELNGQFVTEQVYIHAKVMIIDDRRVIIGSANINERSQAGTRDSEIAACIEDAETIESRLDSKTVRVGRFAHTLRMRLMCEHVGIDMNQVETMQDDAPAEDTTSVLPEASVKALTAAQLIPTFVTESVDNVRHASPSSDLADSPAMSASAFPSAAPTPTTSPLPDPDAFWHSLDCDTNNNDDTVYADWYAQSPLPRSPAIDLSPSDIRHLLLDPLSDAFQTFWHTTARCNTDLFRRAFLVTPDNNVRTWAHYATFIKMAQQTLGRDPQVKSNKTTAAAANSAQKSKPVRDLLHQIRGHLVIWPTHFLEEDDANGEFLFTVDKLVPLEIFD